MKKIILSMFLLLSASDCVFAASKIIEALTEALEGKEPAVIEQEAKRHQDVEWAEKEIEVVNIELNCVVRYKKLWKLLIDKNMNELDLQLAAGISTASIAKLRKDENVTKDVLLKICKALNCDIADIREIARDVYKGKRQWLAG